MTRPSAASRSHGVAAQERGSLEANELRESREGAEPGLRHPAQQMNSDEVQEKRYMTTETIATLEELEREARRSPFAWASSGPVTVYDVDTSTSPNLTRPGYLYRVYGEFVSRDEAAIYAHQCGPLCTQHGDVRDHGAIAL